MPVPARRPLSLPRALVALAALSAALTGVLFLVVLLLIAGWSLEPLAAAAVVSILPVAALAGSRIGGPPAVRAAAGCSLVAGGVLACAWLPGASVGWVIAPLLVAGTGMGLSLGALAGELLPERTPREAAGVLTVRHAGITLVLLLLAPVTSAQLDRAVDRRASAASRCCSTRKLPPLDKLALAGPLVSQLDPVDPRDGLRRALAAGARRFNDDPEQRRVYAEVRVRADEALVGGIDSAFRAAFLICGAFALVGTVAALPRDRRGIGIVAAATAGALLVPAATAAAVPALRAGADPDRRSLQAPHAARHRRHRRAPPGRGARRPRPCGLPLRHLPRGARARPRRPRRGTRVQARARGRSAVGGRRAPGPARPVAARLISPPA